MNMQKYLKPQVAAIQPSVIRKFFDLAAKMEGVVSLGIGEPDFSTPLPFCEAGWRSIQPQSWLVGAAPGHQRLFAAAFGAYLPAGGSDCGDGGRFRGY